MDAGTPGASYEQIIVSEDLLTGVLVDGLSLTCKVMDEYGLCRAFLHMGSFPGGPGITSIISISVAPRPTIHTSTLSTKYVQINDSALNNALVRISVIHNLNTDGSNLRCGMSGTIPWRGFSE